MNDEQKIQSIEDLVEGRFYKLSDLQVILKNLGLNYSIYTIRDYETWKCLDYKCGKRHNNKVDSCATCGGAVRAPIIISPRTRGGGKGPGHRRYSVEEMKLIVDVFTQRK